MRAKDFGLHILCVFLILYFLEIIIKISTSESFKNINVYYPNVNEATKIMTNDTYFNRFNDIDFYVRGLTKDNYKSIAVDKIPNIGIGKTINDRLLRASKF